MHLPPLMASSYGLWCFLPCPGVEVFEVPCLGCLCLLLSLSWFPPPSSPQYIVKCHGNTLLPQFLGMYRVSVDNEDSYMLVMRNMFSHRLPVHRKYDLKVRKGWLGPHGELLMPWARRRAWEGFRWFLFKGRRYTWVLVSEAWFWLCFSHFCLLYLGLSTGLPSVPGSQW